MSGMQPLGIGMTGPGEWGLKDPKIFLALGWRDFRTNIKHTWPLIVAFILYLPA
jgi:hypothetical protein